MKILVYGSKGWIGTQFINIAHNHNIINGTSRLNDIESTSKELDDVKPSHVFCFIGRTHGKIEDTEYSTIDYLEQPGKLVDNVRDNLFSPISLAHLCSNKDIHLTYLGTGCIFKFDDEHEFGQEVNGFTEESKPNFFGSGYSIVKGFTDQLMTLYPNVLNLRIRMPITGIPNKRNFITKITTYDKICSVPNSMSVLPELLPLALQLAERKHTGTLNLTNPNRSSASILGINFRGKKAAQTVAILTLLEFIFKILWLTLSLAPLVLRTIVFSFILIFKLLVFMGNIIIYSSLEAYELVRIKFSSK